MKINVNYEVLYSAIEKFREDKKLTALEKATLMLLIDAAEDDYYPSAIEYEEQAKRVRQINNISYKKNPSFFNKIADECSEFESKYL